MFRTALAASPRPVCTDLPPHLQPMAITSAAPKTDRRVALLGAFAIYGCMPLGLMALDHYIPKLPHKGETTTTIQIPMEVPPPTSASSGSPLPPPPAPPATRTLREPQEPTVPPAASDALPEDLTPKPLSSGAAQTMEGSTTPAGYSGPTDPHADPRTPTHPSIPGPVTGTGTGTVVNLEFNSLHILKQVDPQYPGAARMAHIQGNVILRMVVDEHGVPVKAEVVEGHPLLRSEALRAANLWRFEAARMGGQPVAATFLLTLKFRLV